MSILIPKNNTVAKGYPLGVMLNRKETKGDIGIEVEVEGRHLPGPDHPFGYWAHHVDHSLRGDENAEYVLKKPIPFKDVPTAIDELWKVFDLKKSRIDDSNRTSVHVHLNCQQFHINRLTSFMALYFCFEEMLTEWCGDHRVGNLFCLRAKDAPAIISQLRRFIRSDGKAELRDNLHYSGLNAHALHKFGSLEVRTLRGVSDKRVIADWIKMLERLYNLSADFTDPREICQNFSAEGPLGFFNSILGDTAGILRAGVSFDNDRISDSMFDGIRMAQDLCYCRDWSCFKSVEIQNDPFGRSKKSIAAKVAQLTDQEGVTAWTGGAPPLVLNSMPSWAVSLGSGTVEEEYDPEIGEDDFEPEEEPDNDF